MPETHKEKKHLVNQLLKVLENYPNPHKKGELSVLIESSQFHNRDQTEADYEKEQKAWLDSVKKKKSTSKNK